MYCIEMGGTCSRLGRVCSRLGGVYCRLGRLLALWGGLLADLVYWERFIVNWGSLWQIVGVCIRLGGVCSRLGFLSNRIFKSFSFTISGLTMLRLSCYCMNCKLNTKNKGCYCIKSCNVFYPLFKFTHRLLTGEAFREWLKSTLESILKHLKASMLGPSVLFKTQL